MKWKKIICIILGLLLFSSGICVDDAFQVQAQSSANAEVRETLRSEEHTSELQSQR